MNKTVLIDVDLEYSHDLKQAYENVEMEIERHNSNGYKVVSVTPITGGKYDYSNSENESYGYGYSYTTGILIVFEEIPE